MDEVMKTKNILYIPFLYRKIKNKQKNFLNPIFKRSQVI